MSSSRQRRYEGLQIESQCGDRVASHSGQDVTDRREWEIHQRLLLNEMSHRVKNTLAVVISITRQTFHGTDDPVAALKSFEGRLLALSHAHDLLVEHDWQGADLESLIKVQLGAYLPDTGGRIVTEGPPVMMQASLATPA